MASGRLRPGHREAELSVHVVGLVGSVHGCVAALRTTSFLLYVEGWLSGAPVRFLPTWNL